MSRIVPVALFCLMSSAALAMPQATPGQWEITTKMTMTGMNMQMPAQTVKFCMKPSDAKNIERQAMGGGQHGPANRDCKMLDQNVSGDTVSFHMRCEGKNPTDIQGTVTYGANSYKGKSEVDTTGPKGKMHMTSEFSARRIGDCQ
ncbi:DUF3617 domain-containing protein [Chitinimonas sp.]|uniref:DUF3617 domain-containing protein n=1 Tax=Chitinimonas sp. TaxID=1934313 RepID=UPI002F91F77C